MDNFFRSYCSPLEEKIAKGPSLDFGGMYGVQLEKGKKDSLDLWSIVHDWGMDWGCPKNGPLGTKMSMFQGRPKWPELVNLIVLTIWSISHITNQGRWCTFTSSRCPFQHRKCKILAMFGYFRESTQYLWLFCRSKKCGGAPK